MPSDTRIPDCHVVVVIDDGVEEQDVAGQLSLWHRNMKHWKWDAVTKCGTIQTAKKHGAMYWLTHFMIPKIYFLAMNNLVC
jgi:hypothetical protein